MDWISLVFSLIISTIYHLKVSKAYSAEKLDRCRMRVMAAETFA